MLDFGLIYISVVTFSGLGALALLVMFMIGVRWSRDARRRESRLGVAFERARDVRKHGSIPVGSRYGIFDEKVRRSAAYR